MRDYIVNKIKDIWRNGHNTPNRTRPSGLASKILKSLQRANIFWKHFMEKLFLSTHSLFYFRPFNLHLDFWKSRSLEIKVCFKPNKNFMSCTPGFFSNMSPGFFSGFWYKSSFFSRWRRRKKSRWAGPERFKADLDFSRPWFSEIKVQIKWPYNRSEFSGKKINRFRL